MRTLPDREDMKSRVRHEPFAQALRNSIDDVYLVHSTAIERIDAIKDDKYLSAEGKRDRIGNLLKEQLLPRLHDKTFGYRSGKAQVHGQRQDLGKPNLSESAGAIADRQETRTILRNARDDNARKSMALAMVAEDKSAAEAILSGKTLAHTGLSPQAMSEVRAEYLKTYFAKETTELDKYAENLDALGAVFEVAKQSLTQASGLHPAEFEKLYNEATRGER